MKIYVIRHGLTELNKQGLINGHLDDTLAPEGIEQAKKAAELLPKTIKHIYSSSLGRARETAEILNELLNVKLTFHDELKEVNFGILQGTPYLDGYRLRHEMMDYDWRPSGECLEDFKIRVTNILKVLKAENGDGEALIVGHGGTIRILHFLETGSVMGKIENASIVSFDLDKII